MKIIIKYFNEKTFEEFIKHMIRTHFSILKYELMIIIIIHAIVKNIN